jgi:hypothetical protein
MFFKTLAPVLALIAFSFGGAAHSINKPIELSSDVMLVQENATGTELVEPAGVVPGDTLQFTNSYRNQTTEIIPDFVIVNPVPTNVAITQEAAANVQVSVDGGDIWGVLSALSIELTNGESRAATNEDVTHLRWTVPILAPDQSGTVAYRGKVK